jgi:hypothetical protein
MRRICEIASTVGRDSNLPDGKEGDARMAHFHEGSVAARDVKRTLLSWALLSLPGVKGFFSIKKRFFFPESALVNHYE